MPPTNSRRQVSSQPERWHLSKGVPITLIVALLMQGGSTLWFISKLDSRVALLETTQVDHAVTQRDRDDRQDAANLEAVRLLREQLTAMNGKLDRLIERGSK